MPDLALNVGHFLSLGTKISLSVEGALALEDAAGARRTGGAVLGPGMAATCSCLSPSLSALS
jgi:hypothetical protein